MLSTVVGAAAIVAAAIPSATAGRGVPADTVPISHTDSARRSAAGVDTVPTSRADGADSVPRRVVYSGIAGDIIVRMPRIDTTIVIDGALNAPVWQRAALLTGFSEYTPIDGLPAEDSTEVLVWYSPYAIYFGIRAFEPHGACHSSSPTATRSTPTTTCRSSSVPFLHSRQALVFAVNPLRDSGGWHDHRGSECVAASQHREYSTGRPTTDLSLDFVYDSRECDGQRIRGRRPDPLSEHQIPVGDPQNWGSTSCERCSTPAMNRRGSPPSSLPPRFFPVWDAGRAQGSGNGLVSISTLS